MLPGLGHDPLVGSDHKHDHVHAPNAGHHGAHKFLMSRHIDNAEADPSRKLKMGKAKLNGDAAGFLFLEPVGVNAGQCPDQ